MCKVKFFLRVLRPQPGARLSLPRSSPAPLGHLCVSICTESRRQMYAAATLSWVGWLEKLIESAGGSRAPGSPLPSVHLVQLQSPQRRERKKQPKERTPKLDGNTGRDRERAGFKDFTKWLYLEAKGITCETAPLASFRALPAGGNRLQFAAPSPQPRSGSSCAPTPGPGFPDRLPAIAVRDPSVSIPQDPISERETHKRTPLHSVPEPKGQSQEQQPHAVGGERDCGRDGEVVGQ